MAPKGDRKGSGIAVFESSTKQLESIIEVLENDSTTLEQALASFEQGIKLTRSTQRSLREAEQKVKVLLEGEGQPLYTDFKEQE